MSLPTFPINPEENPCDRASRMIETSIDSIGCFVNAEIEKLKYFVSEINSENCCPSASGPDIPAPRPYIVSAAGEILPGTDGGVTVYCDPGTFLLSGGFEVNDLNTTVSRSVPLIGEGWTANAQNSGDMPIMMTVYALCMPY